MDKGIKSKLSFLNYTVKEVNFLINDEFQTTNKPINIEFEINHNTNVENNRMKIELIIEIFKNMKEQNYPFHMKVKVEGEFTIIGDNIESFEVNGIAILYPYVRAIISTYTANSNMPTLILPPINVAEYCKRNKGDN